jgi:hypothetical protein
MAKKQGISYGPNTALIRGARDVVESESMMGMAGGTAFVKGLTGAVLTGIQEQEKRNSIRDAYIADLGGIQNINLLDEDYNKQQVTDFVRAKRDEYAKLADAYSRTKDTDLLDKMNDIKFSFSNLNKQLQGLVMERKEYLDAYDKGQLVDLPGDEKYTNMYTNKGQFNIETNGDIGFTIEGEYSKLKDIAGKWNVKNNIAETFILQQNLNAKKNGEANRSFYRDDIKNLYTNSFKQTGPEGIMVTAKTDLTGDNEYILSNGQKAGNLSFESMWSQGLLDKKFYEQIPKGTDSKWMYDRKNSLILNDLIAEYYTDVTKYSFDEGNKNYKSKINNNNTKPGNFIIGGQTFNARDFNNSFVPFINKLAKPSEGELFVSPTGMKFKYEKNNYYVYDANTRKIDKDNPMTFNDIAISDGWANYVDFSKPKPE